jgi:tetratricopeptide (TPR) repeat protein
MTSQEVRRPTNRKPVLTSPGAQGRPVMKLNQRDMDSSCHRLSRVPKKFAVNKSIQNEKQELYAISYFKTNPGAKDTTPPERKLELFEEKLAQVLEPPERFATLVQQKAVRYIVFGDTSREALRSHLALGTFYNENSRPASAIRHLGRAQQLEDSNDIENWESIQIRVEMADAYLTVRAERKSESAHNIDQAEQTITPCIKVPIEDPHLRYRRDLVLARLSLARNRGGQALAEYEMAWGSLDEANGGDEREETAELYAELARCAEGQQQFRKAADNYQKAYELYRKLGLDQKAEAIIGKQPTGDEVDAPLMVVVKEEESVMPPSEVDSAESEIPSRREEEAAEHPPEPELEEPVEQKQEVMEEPELEVEPEPELEKLESTSGIEPEPQGSGDIASDLAGSFTGHFDTNEEDKGELSSPGGDDDEHKMSGTAGITTEFSDDGGGETHEPEEDGQDSGNENVQKDEEDEKEEEKEKEEEEEEGEDQEKEQEPDQVEEDKPDSDEFD